MSALGLLIINSPLSYHLRNVTRYSKILIESLAQNKPHHTGMFLSRDPVVLITESYWIPATGMQFNFFITCFRAKISNNL